MNSRESNANYRRAIARAASVKLGRILLVITMLVLGTQAAQAQQQDLCPAGPCVCSNDAFLASGLNPPYPHAEWSDPSTAPDLIVNGPCKVAIRTSKTFQYYFKNVRILEGGILSFVEEDQSDSGTHFWASSIIVENGGKLIAGSQTAPFGSNGGFLIIHLWGSDQGASGQGAVCASPPGTNPELDSAASPIKSGTAKAQARFPWPAVRTIFINTRLCPLTTKKGPMALATLAIRSSPFPTAAR